MNKGSFWSFILIIAFLFPLRVFAVDPELALKEMQIQASDMTAEEKHQATEKLRKEWASGKAARDNERKALLDKANEEFEKSSKSPSDKANLFFKQQQLKQNMIRESDMSQEEKLKAFRELQAESYESIETMNSEERNAVGSEAKKNFDEISKALNE